MWREQQSRFFNALSRDRADNADIIEKPSMRGIKYSIVERYSDQAHFIYELIQNADDAKATSARFELHRNHLVFAHNGTKRFSISDPRTEEEDGAQGQLGDINSITSVAGSNKTSASIGKFGVGFKSVFQYTKTPYIYDPDIFFKIERFIVPIRVWNDLPNRKPNETLFLFPFDHDERSPEDAFADIASKLASLTYPTLFLRNLKEVSFKYDDMSGFYNGVIERRLEFGGTVAELTRLVRKKGNELLEETLWLFSRLGERGLSYSVGFFLDDSNQLSPRSLPAFCFFPTKETTGLNFIIDAPFLLTDNREGIRARIPHNVNMMDCLAQLAADSLIYLKEIGQNQASFLIDDDIFDIIPYDQSRFASVDSVDGISFKPFYTVIKETLQTEDLLPARDGYCNMKNAYWASVPQIAQVFSDKQLALLIGNRDARWVFTSVGRQETYRRNRPLCNYIDSITQDWVDEEDLIKKITAEFIESQPLEWLHGFYKYVAETKGRTDLIKMKPVFLNQSGKAVPAFDEQGQLILFLPCDGFSGYETINPVLLQNEDTLKFVQQLGITEPSLKNEIYNFILPRYQDGANVDSDPDFLKFFKYYKECPQSEVRSYIKLIKDCPFVKYHYRDRSVVSTGTGSELYFPTPELIAYFTAKPDARFVDLDHYESLIGEEDLDNLKRFLLELGVAETPRIGSRKLTTKEAHEISSDWQHSTWYREWVEKYIDGCKESVESIVTSSDKDSSLILWNELLRIIRENCSQKQGFDKVIGGRYSYFYRNEKHEYFDSTNLTMLRTEPWLLNLDNQFESPNNLTVQTLSPVYEIQTIESQELLRSLGIKDSVSAAQLEACNLSEDLRRKINMVDKLEQAGVTDDNLEELLSIWAKMTKVELPLKTHTSSAAKNYLQAPEAPVQTSFEDNDRDHILVPSKPSVARILEDVARQANSPEPSIRHESVQKSHDSFIPDEDYYIRAPVDYSMQMEHAKQEAADEIARIARIEELQQKALASRKYTFGWFKALLELEILSGQDRDTRRQGISISFAKVELELGTTRTLVLKHPNRYIPQSMEDLSDIPLVLHYGDQTKTVAVEVVNIKSYTLRAKLRTHADIEDVDLASVTEAVINVRDPAFLLGELLEQLKHLNLSDDYNMQENLCENIEFVFGPPGTGKTTYLVQNIILPIMQEREDLRVLVLTPTNKAADVLVSRVMEIMGEDTSYNDWLARFGTTNDPSIEQSKIYRDKTFDIRALDRTVTVTTIARFPYDYFMPDRNTRLHLRALNWDYIVFDEASMIPLVNIILPLCSKTPKTFVISGDPFQIQPITSINLWKDENIFTMAGLRSFTEPVTTPHRYPVELLTTQYRSVPAIGELFSQFAYGGVLSHYRTNETWKQLNVDGLISAAPLNIIKFPVSKYESIYRPKRLQNKSAYHIYSPLFTFEFAKYLSSLIAAEHHDQSFKIGIVAPYRAQADLIDKLMASAQIPNSVDIQVGTIHGFQGDECDVILAVFNPPPSITSSPDMFLNKLNIVNVSISRARDYLFIIMPDDETENVTNLTLVKQVEGLCKRQGCYAEMHTHFLERLMFGSESYLEDNSFSTTHQLVNVYGEPETYYEIRSEDAAVDVQVHVGDGRSLT